MTSTRYDNDKLLKVVEAVKRMNTEGHLPIVLFDLDDTLFSTAPRNLRILQEFADDNRGRWPELAEKAVNVSLSDLGWNYQEPLVRQGLPQDHPALAELQAYWEVHFLSNEYVWLDLPTDGAANFVRRCHEVGALVYYLTGRHISSSESVRTDSTEDYRKRTNKLIVYPGMEFGTAKAITDRGFPFWQGRCELHLKPKFETPDGQFKSDAVSYVKSFHGVVVATFDNEPGNVDLFRRAFPPERGTMNFLLDTINSPEGEPLKKELMADPSVMKVANFVVPVS